MFEKVPDLYKYVRKSYPEVTDARIDADHWDLACTKCGVTRGFQVLARHESGNTVSRYKQSINAYVNEFEIDSYAPKTYLFMCPVCKSFKHWIVYEISQRAKGQSEFEKHYYKVVSLPAEGLEDIDELPSEPPALRIAYREAIRSLNAGAYLAAAAMFRRALQVITRQILGATPGNLDGELRQVMGKTFNGVTFHKSYADLAYIIKEAGNQGAHPDRDPDLIEFTLQDAEDLQSIFMDLVSELFVAPAAVEKAKKDFAARRKIPPKS